LTIQPISLAYTRARDGTPLVGSLRSLYCWFGPGELLPHLMRALGAPGGEVEMRFHSHFDARAIGDRKQLARHVEAIVRGGVAEANARMLGAAGGVLASRETIADASDKRRAASA
jgi:hypothetical protein